MSSTVMYAAGADGEFSSFRKFHNSSRGAMFVWRALFDKYGTKRSQYDHVLSDGSLDLLFKAVDEMSPNERMVMLSTADRVVVSGEGMLKLADAFDGFAQLHRPDGFEPSLPEQARALRELYKQDPRPRAVAWCQTTVSEFSLGVVAVECETCGCTCGDNYRPYSMDTDEGHWDLFEALVESDDDDG